jgi:hypothetical protein
LINAYERHLHKHNSVTYVDYCDAADAVRAARVQPLKRECKFLANCAIEWNTSVRCTPTIVCVVLPQ